MIFYFSGTGNSRWVAQELGRALGERAADICDVEEVPGLAAEARVGVVFPIHAWGVPEPVVAFLRRMEIPRRAFTFGVCTCGSEAGRAMDDLSRLIALDSAYSIVMPNNYIVAADLEAPNVVREKLEHARASIATIAAEVVERKPVCRVHEGGLATIKTRLANQGFNRFARSTRPFRATDACIGCGLCARRCPAHAIEMRDGRPAWTRATCYQCLRCINGCPQAAIEYGKGTCGRGRYSIDDSLGV